MIKGSLYQEDITIVNNYVPNIKTSKYIKQLLTYLRAKRNSDVIIVGNFNTPHSTIERSYKMNMEIMNLNYTVIQTDLTDVYGTIHPTAREYTFFSSTHRTFSRIDHILSIKQVLTHLRLKLYQVSFLTAIV